MRVLIIEDEAPLRQQMSQQLRSKGYAVDATGEGAEGLFMGNEYPVDVAILDLGLPEKIAATRLDGRNDYTFPMASTVNFQFPERNNMPAMDIDWYDGAGNHAPPALWWVPVFPASPWLDPNYCRLPKSASHPCDQPGRGS